jgi:actin related protein 2/3 complex subunit 3
MFSWFDCVPDDIIDETLGFFKANILFRNFNVKGDADRLLIYATLYVSACLNKIVKKNKTEATALITGMGLENNFALPGDAKFPLGGLVSKPASTQEADTLRQYLAQMRQEIGIRLLEKVYARDNTQPDKWWMCFQKRKFLNMEL